jgi:hypothetical protein
MVVTVDTSSRDSQTVTYSFDSVTGKSERIYAPHELVSPFYPCSKCIMKDDDQEGDAPVPAGIHR